MKFRLCSVWLALIVFSLWTDISVAGESADIEIFILDYPHGGDRIHVWANGDAYLYYGASPKSYIIKKDTFKIDRLYGQFKEHLKPNLPREQRENPEAICGMVTLVFNNKVKTSYLICEVEYLTSQLFKIAKENIAVKHFQLN